MGNLGLEDGKEDGCRLGLGGCSRVKDCWFPLEVA